MKKTKPNRRVKLTKILLKEALTELLGEYHISKISVKALCELADINRSTFYTHYNNQYDLLHEVEQEVLENFKFYLDKQKFNDEKPLSIQVLTQILEYVKEDTELFKALLSENCESSFQREIIELSQLLSMQVNPGTNTRIRSYLNTFGLMGAMSLLNKWLQDGTPESPEQMAELIIQALYHGIMSF